MEILQVYFVLVSAFCSFVEIRKMTNYSEAPCSTCKACIFGLFCSLDFIQSKYYFEVDSVKFNLKCFRNFLPHMFNGLFSNLIQIQIFSSAKCSLCSKIIYSVKIPKCSKICSL